MSKTLSLSAFSEWIDQQADSASILLPLTHITKSLVAREVIKQGKIEPAPCPVFNLPLSYCFYGRPAYRVSSDKTVKLEASCPVCFVFDGEMIKRAREIYAFDTGAFNNRLYNHVLDEGFELKNFSLGTNAERPNKIIDRVFASVEAYLNGDRGSIPDPASIAEAFEFEARAYLALLLSAGRNEPDDRICSIEITFGDVIPIPGQLKAVVAPHTLCTPPNGAPWLVDLATKGIDILPYHFTPGRPPEHYHTLLEVVLYKYYRDTGLI